MESIIRNETANKNRTIPKQSLETEEAEEIK